MENKVLVFSTSIDHLAEIARAKLEAESIPVLILNQKDSTYQSFGSIELYVSKDDFQKARHIIEKINERIEYAIIFLISICQ